MGHEGAALSLQDVKFPNLNCTEALSTGQEPGPELLSVFPDAKNEAQNEKG